MRWPVMIFLTFAAAAIQMSAGHIMAVAISPKVSLSVDFLSILTVFVAVIVRTKEDALWAAWLIGMLVDLSVTSAPIGMNALTFVAAAVVTFNFRAVVFTDSPITQAVLAFVFCVIAHGLSCLFMNLYVRPGLSGLWPGLLQVFATAFCTAVIAPAALWSIKWLDKYLLIPSARRRRR